MRIPDEFTLSLSLSLSLSLALSRHAMPGAGGQRGAEGQEQLLATVCTCHGLPGRSPPCRSLLLGLPGLTQPKLREIFVRLIHHLRFLSLLMPQAS